SGLLPVRRGDKWGYVDERGTQVIDFEHDGARPFPSQKIGGARLAAVRHGDKWGYIVTKSKRSVTPTPDGASQFCEDRASVTIEDKMVLVDAAGYALSKRFDRIDAMLDGMARVVRNDTFNFIGPNGKLLSKKWFTEAPHYGDGLATVKNDND